MFAKIILLIFIFFISSCTKKTEFIPFPEGKYLVPLEDMFHYEIFKKPDDSAVFKRIGVKEQILKINGVLRLIPINEYTVENFFFEITCPEVWKCIDGKAYLKRDSYRFDKDFSYGKNQLGSNALLLEKSELDRLSPTIDFLLKKKFDLPKTGIDGKVFQFIVSGNTPRLENIITLKALINTLHFRKLDSRNEPLLNKDHLGAKQLTQLHETTNVEVLKETFDGYPKEVLDKSSLKILEQEISKQFQEYYASPFFGVESTWQEIAEKFNSFHTYPYFQEYAFQKILDSGLFTISGRTDYQLVGITLDKSIPSARWNLEIKEGDGVTLVEKLSSGSSTKSELKKIAAKAEEDSLAFSLETTDGILEIQTKELPKVFYGFEKVKNYLKGLPKTYKELVNLKSSDPRSATILVAMKFGKGGFDRKKGEYIYEISDINHIIYLFKNNNIINAGEDEYSGEVYGHHDGADIYTAITRWYQKYDKQTKSRSVFLNYTAGGCGRECSETKHNDNLCFTTGDTLIVHFKQPILNVAIGESSFATEYGNFKLESTRSGIDFACFLPFQKD